MIYRVYSDFSHSSDGNNIVNSWSRDEITNIAIKDSDLYRNVDGLPYLKDILDIGYSYCKSDNDIILYTNSDIGLVRQHIIFPENNFFCVRKNVDKLGSYTSEDLANINYENSINCDIFGITKKWYEEHRDEIPDFLIGSPTWDLCMLLLIQGERIDNICYHVKHESEWKQNQKHPKHLRNKKLFTNFCENKNLGLIQEDGEINYDIFYKLMSENFGFSYVVNPKYIIYSTISHDELLDLNVKSIRNIHADNVIVYLIKDDKQYCESASYHSTGWRQTQVNKLNSVINTINSLRDGEVFIFCDADILHGKNYLKQIQNYLNECDLVAQKSFTKNSSHKYCSGFYCGKKTPKVLKFLQYIRQSLISEINNESNADQYYFNEYSSILNIKELDDTYFSPGLVTDGKLLEEHSFNDVINSISNNFNIVHANWIVGTDKKINFLKTLSK